MSSLSAHIQADASGAIKIACTIVDTAAAACWDIAPHLRSCVINRASNLDGSRGVCLVVGTEAAHKSHAGGSLPEGIHLHLTVRLPETAVLAA